MACVIYIPTPADRLEVVEIGKLLAPRKSIPSPQDAASGASATDDALIARIVQQDKEAFEMLMNRHLNPLHSYLLRMTRSKADAEDLAQECFFRVWQKASTFHPGRVKVSTWIHTIAHNLCIDTFRKHREFSAQALPEAIDESADQLQLLHTERLRTQLETAIAELPDNQRSAFLLCQLQGFSNAEAAEILSIRTRALESLLARARRNLRTQILPPLEGAQMPGT